MPNESFKEAFLHYIWQFQYFQKHDLKIQSGEELIVFSPGFANSHAGPDFQHARLSLGEVEWHGQVEIHYHSSDWTKHKHHTDAAYNNVILHVVWDDNINAVRQDGNPIPTLELKGRVDRTLIAHFEQLVKTTSPIPCASYLVERRIDPVIIYSMLERCLVERLEQKSAQILLIHQQTRQDWEETAYRWVGKCFGFKINSHAFLKLCELLPFALLKKYRLSPMQMEALLFGTGGFLEGHFEESYPKQLQSEFEYLTSKHQLRVKMLLTEWKFLRLRPANFPTLRISQFANFLSNAGNLYDLIFGPKGLNDFSSLIAQNCHPYWQEHFVFNKPSQASKERPRLGHSSRDNLIINAFLPLRFSFAQLLDLEEMKINVVDDYRKIKAEKNSLISQYGFLSLSSVTSYETQAITQLHHSYCEAKKCLSCHIGHELIHP